MKRSELINAAKELNTVLGLEPAINIKDPVKQLQSAVKQAAELIDPAEDEFSPETQAILNALTGTSNAPEKEVEVEVEKEEEVEVEKEEEVEAAAPAPEPEKKAKDKEEKPKTKAPKEKTAKPKKEPKEKAPSPFGTALEIMCKNPDMSSADLIASIQKAGFDPDDSKAAIRTAYSSVRKVVALLEANGWKRG